MQIRPYFKLHGHQSFRKTSSSSSIRQHVNCVDKLTKPIFFEKRYFCLLGNVSGRIECKLGPISNCMAISHPEEIRQFVNLVEELTKELTKE